MNANQAVNVSGTLAIDAQGLDKLKLQAKLDPKSAIGAASKQFEAVFLNMVLKSMREATPQDTLMGSEQTRFYTSMFDQQLSQTLSNRGTGLAAAMARQLSAGISTPATDATGQTPAATPATGGAAKSLKLPASLSQAAGATDPALAKVFSDLRAQAAAMPDAVTASAPAVKARQDALRAALAALDGSDSSGIALTPAASSPADAPAAAKSAADGGTSLVSKTRDFVSRMWSHAVDAARSIGVRPQFMVGQAALETGWGKHEIRNADGSSTHNLFGIKAGSDWTGPVAEKTTTEYVNGVAQKTTAKFRVYGSYAESFADYAKLLQGSPRYSNVLSQAQNATGFARGLQKAGYATDPAYADKLIRVINGPSMQQAMMQASPTQAAQAVVNIDTSA